RGSQPPGGPADDRTSERPEMSALIGLIAGLIGLAALLTLFMRTDARALANWLRLAGPVIFGLVGAAFVFIGRAGIGGMLISLALAWFAAARRQRMTTPMPMSGRRSTVRTAALEMELDHETGGLEGLVLAGTFEGRMLGSLAQPALIDLYAELR